MGTESDPLEEELTQVYCFHHLLLLEYTAARFLSTLPKVDSDQTITIFTD